MCRKFLMLVLILMSIAKASTAENQDLHSQISSEADEYEIYSIIIEDLFIREDTDILVITNRTIPSYSLDIYIDRGWLRSILGRRLSRELVGRLKDNNKKSQALGFHFMLPIGYELQELREVCSWAIEKGPFESYKEFFEKYASSTGIINFSKAGFNKECNKALVYVLNNCGALCLNEYLMLLNKEENRWKIQTRLVIREDRTWKMGKRKQSWHNPSTPNNGMHRSARSELHNDGQFSTRAR